MIQLIAHGISIDFHEISFIFLKDKETYKKIQRELTGILDCYTNLVEKVNQRKTIEGPTGVWYFIRYSSGLYFAICSSDYPMRIIYQLLAVIL